MVRVGANVNRVVRVVCVFVGGGKALSSGVLCGVVDEVLAVLWTKS